MFAAPATRCATVVALALVTGTARGEQDHSDSRCLAADVFFLDELWAKIGQQTCLKCHHAEGDASDSDFLLQDPSRLQASARPKAHTHNRDAFAKMATIPSDNSSRLLLKATGELDHGGGEVLKTDSPGLRILARFVDRIKGTIEPPERVADDYRAPPFFQDIQMLSPQRLLRRVTLSLAGRLPTDDEKSRLTSGPVSLDAILDDVMREDAFYDRLAEGFNDIFLTIGYDGVPERVLGYRNFGETRQWTQKIDFSHIKDEKERRQAGYKLTDDYRDAILREPMELIKYIVRHDRPFTELVTADYIMVSPYTARGYGIFEELKSVFEDSENRLEFIPAKITALTRNDGKPDQESPTGLFPHSGMLTTFHWLRRYPTTETNRNRLRSRMYYQHFLGVDVMALAPRVSDAAAIDAKYEVPTMEAAECVVCHKTVDPVAGLFQDFYDTTDNFGPYGPRKEGWFTDMFGPGREGDELPEAQRWRALQWLGERTARDPRFARAMVEHVYYILTGRKVLLPPQNIDDPLFASRRRAYQTQRDEIDAIAEKFAGADFNLKIVFKEWIKSKFYRADGFHAAAVHSRRQAELDDVGVMRLLSPEQLDRKITAIFGKPWDKFGKDLRILYGGIDSKEITERLVDPGGAMGAVQRIMANHVACRNVAADFALPIDQRRLFPDIDPGVVPVLNGHDTDQDANRQIRRAIVHLHQLLLGREDAIDDPEVDRTFQLFAGIVEEAKSHEGIAPTESYFCQAEVEVSPRDPDPEYTIRAWRGVVTYLLRQEEFLYE